MEIEKSRNGFYTVTFVDKNDMVEEEIEREFSSVGKVCKVVKNFQRVFIRFREKEEAEKAIAKYGKLYQLRMAKNNNENHSEFASFKNTFSKKQDSCRPSSLNNSNSSGSMDNLVPGCTVNSGYHLILANLPKDYSVKDVNALVKETSPKYINELGETRVFKIKACHVVLDSSENLSYLINKLDGFVICGEKLRAIEARNLLEWRTVET